MPVGNYLKGPSAHGSSLYLPNRVKLDQKTSIWRVSDEAINHQLSLPPPSNNNDHLKLPKVP